MWIVKTLLLLFLRIYIMSSHVFTISDEIMATCLRCHMFIDGLNIQKIVFIFCKSRHMHMCSAQKSIPVQLWLNIIILVSDLHACTCPWHCISMCIIVIFQNLSLLIWLEWLNANCISFFYSENTDFFLHIYCFSCTPSFFS